MSPDNLERAVDCTRAVLGRVESTQMDDATPCAKWTVRDLINHIVGVQFFFAGALAGNPPIRTQDDFASRDFLVAFEEGSSAMIARFADPAVMATTYTVPMGPMTGEQMLAVATSDTFVHGWDLARATGQDTNLAPDLADDLLQGARASFPPELRADSGDPFGPEMSAPPGAPRADQLAAFFGRTV